MSVAGFALRRNISDDASRCPDHEKDCGITADPFRACCPHGAFCPVKDNKDCCPKEHDNCTPELLEAPRCANDSWDLYHYGQVGDYFCCEKNQKGYAVEDGSSFGCASPGFKFENNERELDIEVPSPAPDPPESGPPVGAVAGGTVGGVVALALAATAIWWFCVRRRRKTEVPYEEPHKKSAFQRPTTPPPPPPGELPEQHGVTELGGRKHMEPSQLPSQHGVTELPT